MFGLTAFGRQGDQRLPSTFSTPALGTHPVPPITLHLASLSFAFFVATSQFFPTYLRLQPPFFNVFFSPSASVFSLPLSDSRPTQLPIYVLGLLEWALSSPPPRSREFIHSALLPRPLRQACFRSFHRRTPSAFLYLGVRFYSLLA